ncbi:peptidase M20 [Actinomadura craniellae]|uniref:Probable succinyl-diaminopimelate desuccinylase n=1 Tax=Actinomadura craniellae TaxID=2231787 RepID=A0A365HAM8_9ACTN|nr:ArgE/DapE family deacylase [Actinomadura craniellae]RAY16072.1 peptidase M20 [Actinomadura craniellae]
MRDRLAAALAAETGALTRLLTELVRIPSPGGSPGEVAIQSRLAEWLRAEGLDVDHWRLPLADLTARPDFPGMEVPRVEAWGVAARLPGSGGGRSLMFNGHVDVVPPGEPAAWRECGPYDALVRDGMLYGRGACDMKGGLVAALFAVRALRRCGIRLRGDLIVACVAGEEDGGLGTYGLLDRGWRADACVIPEPTGLDVVPANAGALTFRLKVTGRAAHAARRTAGISAVERFWPVFAALRELEARRNADVDLLMRRWDVPYAIEVGTVHAGDWAATVPGELVAEGRIGVALGEPVEAARQALEDAVTGHGAEVEWWGGRFAAGPPPAGDLVARLAAAHRAAAGRALDSPDVWGAPYGSDLRLLAAAGVPTVQYGPGELDRMHAPDERVRISEVVTAAHALALLALDHCGTAPGAAGVSP